MMKRVISMMAVAAAMAWAGPGSAHEVTLTDKFDPQFSLWFPNEWTVTLKDDRITAVSDNGMLWCGVWDLKSTPTLEAARSRIRQRAQTMFTDVEFDEPVELDLLGMRGGSVEGRGKHDGKDIVFFIVGFQHAEDRVGVVAFVGDPAIRRLYRSTIIDIVVSIRPDAEFYASPLATEDKEESAR